MASGGHVEPDPRLTPGLADPRVTQENIDSTICLSGYTAKVRPRVSYTNRLKRKQLAELGWPDQNASDYEEDHAIPLELGGHPSDPRNLWPETYAGKWGARRKDRLETRLHRLVCSHLLGLLEAQTAITSGWIAAYGRFVEQE